MGGNLIFRPLAHPTLWCPKFFEIDKILRSPLRSTAFDIHNIEVSLILSIYGRKNSPRYDQNRHFEPSRKTFPWDPGWKVGEIFLPCFDKNESHFPRQNHFLCRNFRWVNRSDDPKFRTPQGPPYTPMGPKDHFLGPRDHFWGPRDHFWGPKDHF